MINRFINYLKSIFTGSDKTSLKAMTNLILFGPPGSGKGTQAKHLMEKYNLLHISTGDLFRYEIGNKTELGLKAREYMDQGKLVPDEVTIGMLENKINANPEVAGYLLDGFPRTIPQCEALDAFMVSKDQTVSGLVALEVNDEEIVQRLLKRGETSGRPDDSNEEVIRKRIAVYNEETSPVYDYYKKQNKSHTVDGIGSEDEIFNRLSTTIDSLL